MENEMIEKDNCVGEDGESNSTWTEIKWKDKEFAKNCTETNEYSYPFESNSPKKTPLTFT